MLFLCVYYINLDLKKKSLAKKNYESLPSESHYNIITNCNMDTKQLYYVTDYYNSIAALQCRARKSIVENRHSLRMRRESRNARGSA